METVRCRPVASKSRLGQRLAEDRRSGVVGVEERTRRVEQRIASRDLLFHGGDRLRLVGLRRRLGDRDARRAQSERQRSDDGCGADARITFPLSVVKTVRYRLWTLSARPPSIPAWSHGNASARTSGRVARSWASRRRRPRNAPGSIPSSSGALSAVHEICASRRSRRLPRDSGSLPASCCAACRRHGDVVLRQQRRKAPGAAEFRSALAALGITAGVDV